MFSKMTDHLRAGKRVVALTGAGISAESGVPTFRGADGLWRNFRAEDLATPAAFARDPRLVWEWYAWRRELISPCRPNAAHDALARLERERPRDFVLVTQNVDGLHQLAGSENVVELHGNIWKLRCLGCGAERQDRSVPLPAIPPICPRCGGLERPGVVWFGESLPEDALARAFAAAESCDVMLVVGTSAVVYPAAYLPQLAKNHGAYVIEINPDETPLTPLADESHRGKAAVVLPSLLGF